MNLFCKHDWKIVNKTYREPYWEDVDQGAFFSGWYRVQKERFGDYTTILFQCTKCKKTKQEVMDGKIL